MQALESYLESILAQVQPLEPTSVPVHEALGAVLAEDIVARLAVPPFTNSAMDGFAFRYSDWEAALADSVPADAAPEQQCVTLPVVGDIPAGDGHPYECLPGQAWRIMTGAKVPEGADTVVPVEDTNLEPGPCELPPTVEIRGAIRPGQHVRCRGEDAPVGSVVLHAGTVLSAAALSSAVSVGYAEIPVYPKVRIAVISTGDELRRAGEDLEGAQIPDSNSVLLAALCARADAEVTGLFHSHDQAEEFAATLEQAGACADLIITSGGVSAGAYDVVKEVGSLSGMSFTKVAMQPGKPQGFGVLETVDGRRVLIATLPGNPVSVFVSFHMFVRPLLAALTGRDGRDIHRPLAVTTPVGWTSPRGKRQFVPVHIDEVDQAGETPLATLTHRLGSRSHFVASLHSVNALLIVPEEVTEVAPWSVLTAIRV